MLLLPLILGCADIAKLKALGEGVANPLVMVGAYIGVEPPTDPSLDLSGSDFSSTAFVSTVFANATSVTNLADDPVTDAVATWKSEVNGKVDLVYSDAGSYTATSEDGIVYTDGETVVIGAESEGTHIAAVDSPPAAQFAIEPEHTTGEGAVVNLDGQDYDSVFVVVLDVLSGETTFDNRPTDIAAIYEWTHGSGETSVAIPGGAFANQSAYAVGVAGMRHSDSSDFTDANTLLSTYASGKFSFYPVSTLPTAP